MARPVPIECPGAIYHLSSRMVGTWGQIRDRLFRDEWDCECFLQRLSETGSGDEYLLRLSRYVHQKPVWTSAWKDRPIREGIRRYSTTKGTKW